MCARGTVSSKHSLIVIRTQHSIVYVLSSVWHHQLPIHSFLSLKCTGIMKKIQSSFGMDWKSPLNYFRSLAKSFCVMSKRYLWRRYFLVSSEGFQGISQTVWQTLSLATHSWMTQEMINKLIKELSSMQLWTALTYGTNFSLDSQLMEYQYSTKFEQRTSSETTQRHYCI